MKKSDWDRHETAYCARCEHDRTGRRACPIKTILHNNPQDEQALKPIKRLGRCSQFSPKPEPEPKKAKRQQPRKRK